MNQNQCTILRTTYILFFELMMKHEALFEFVSDFFDQTRNKFLQTKNEFRYQQQDAIIVIERLLSTNELANYCPHFREAVMVPTCRSSGQLCTHRHVVYNPKTSDFAGVLQGTVKNEGNDNLQHIVDEQQDEKVEANCSTCRAVMVKR